MTPFEYWTFAASGNLAAIASGNLLSKYMMDGGFLTCLLLSANSSKKIRASALSVVLSNYSENETVTSVLAGMTQYFSSCLYGISQACAGSPLPAANPLSALLIGAPIKSLLKHENFIAISSAIFSFYFLISSFSFLIFSCSSSESFLSTSRDINGYSLTLRFWHLCRVDTKRNIISVNELRGGQYVI